MKHTLRATIILFAALFSWASCVAAATESGEAHPSSIAALERTLSDASRRVNGVVGVAAWRIDGRGPRILVRAGEAFPMASTFKVAVAATVFAEIDQGQLSLDQMVPLDEMMRVPSDLVAERIIHPGVSLSIYNWLELMITESDNTATDMMTKLAGGPQTITAWLNKNGIHGMRVDNDTAGILQRFFRLPKGPYMEVLRQAHANGSYVDRGDHPYPDFDDSPLDTSTPEAMADLLQKIFAGGLLRPESAMALEGIMERTRTGTERIKGYLPEGTVVAHKTGSVGGTINDVGLIALPGRAGKILIAVFVKKSDVPVEKREHVIADIARSIYDFYLSAE